VGAPASFWEAIGKTAADYANLTWGNFFLANLLPVTIGNITGGSMAEINPEFLEAFLDEYIPEQMESRHVPGLVIEVVQGDKVLLSNRANAYAAQNPRVVAEAKIL
jgi:hypothetical protein